MAQYWPHAKSTTGHWSIQHKKDRWCRYKYHNRLRYTKLIKPWVIIVITQNGYILNFYFIFLSCLLFIQCVQESNPPLLSWQLLLFAFVFRPPPGGEGECFWLIHIYTDKTWWRHQMETFSALLAICAGNSPVPGEFPTQRPVTRSFDVYFDLRPNKRLSKQSWGWRFETLSCSLWRHRNE